jgi:hypothetical protein
MKFRVAISRSALDLGDLPTRKSACPHIFSDTTEVIFAPAPCLFFAVLNVFPREYSYLGEQPFAALLLEASAIYRLMAMNYKKYKKPARANDTDE